jgi:short-subunit dehydrogenase
MARVNPRDVLVTGASSGFGRAIARTLAQRGHNVVGTSRKAEVPESVAAGRLTMAPLDVDSDASVGALPGLLATLAFVPNVLVLNAGFGTAGSLEGCSVTTAKQQFETNFFGVHRVVKTFLPHLRERGSARIIVVGSLGGILALPFQGMYSASKFALEAYVDVLILETAMHGIQATLLQPGDFATGFTANRAQPDGSDHAAYEPAMSNALRIMAMHEEKGRDPQVLADLVCKLLEKRKLKARYKVGSVTETIIANLAGRVPGSCIRAILRSLYQVPGAPNPRQRIGE